MTARKIPALDRARQALENWKAIVGALVALVGFGMAAQACVSGLARAADVAQVRAEAQAVAVRTTVVESSLGELRDSLKDLKGDLRFVREQLIEIAKTTGARTVAAPARSNP